MFFKDLNMKVKIASVLSRFLIYIYKLRYGKRVIFGQNVIVNHRFKIKGKGQLIIGDNVNMWAHQEANAFHFYDKNAIIKIGQGTRLNGVACHCAKLIEIGKNCMIGSANIMDTDFHTFDDKGHILYGNQKNKSIKIGDHVWLCGQSVVLKGITIENKSVVAFRTVVTKNIPKNAVVAGNPGKIVKQKS